ncbi:hypothetical protein [Streptomyces aureoversilis]|uniref:Secreted protein n=1 Tax=Streptomyces aureoversilis TaxID=67277 RepID=A0ABW0A0K9_9ACTN
MRAIARIAVAGIVLGTCLGWSGAATADTGRPQGDTTVTAPVGFELPDDWEKPRDPHCVTTTAWGDSWCPGKPLM